MELLGSYLLSSSKVVTHRYLANPQGINGILRFLYIMYQVLEVYVGNREDMNGIIRFLCIRFLKQALEVYVGNRCMKVGYE